MKASEYALAQSPLLTLPRELRDEILANLLLHGTVPFECGITSIPNFREVEDDEIERSPVTEQQALQEYPLRCPCTGRRSWTVPLRDVTGSDRVFLPSDGRREESHMTYADGISVGLTYQLLGTSECIDLGIMLVCKQLYQEASEMFYGRNIFSFKADFRMPTALSFLQDRPPAALLHINSLELAFLETGSVLGRLQRPQTVEPPLPAGFGLEFGYDFYQQLCSLISSPAMQLCHLIIVVETYVACHGEPGDGAPVTINSIRTCLLHEDVFPFNIQAWFDSLLAIKGLESVSVWWTISKGYLKRTARCLDKIQTLMLRDKLSTPEVTDASGGRSIEFYARVVSDIDSSAVRHVGINADAALTYNVDKDEIQWRDCILRIGESQFVEVEEEEVDNGTALTHDLTCVYPALLRNFEGHPGTTVYHKLIRK